MKILRSAVLLCSVFAVLTLGGGAYADPIKERKKLMKSVKDNVGLLVGMMKGKTPYDKAAADAAFAAIGAVPDKFVKLFPEGSQEDPLSESKYESKYYATDAVWAKMEEFKEKGEELEDVVEAAANSDSQQSLAGAMKEVFDGCKSCHKTYREKF